MILPCTNPHRNEWTTGFFPKAGLVRLRTLFPVVVDDDDDDDNDYDYNDASDHNKVFFLRNGTYVLDACDLPDQSPFSLLAAFRMWTPRSHQCRLYPLSPTKVEVTGSVIVVVRVGSVGDSLVTPTARTLHVAVGVGGKVPGSSELGAETIRESPGEVIIRQVDMLCGTTDCERH